MSGGSVTQYAAGGQVPPRPAGPPVPPGGGAAVSGPPVPPGAGAPVPPSPPTSPPPPAPQAVPAPAPQPVPPPQPVPAPAAQPAPVPVHATVQLSTVPVPPGGTGHFVLPPGTPVQLPAHPPRPHAPAGPIAVLLIGPAGAGKTTVARYWAERRPTPTAHVSLDDVREWVQSGFANPQAGWNNASEAQYRLARRTCGFACRNYLANGISCIIDDAVFPDRPAIGLGGWKRHIGPGMLPVVLLPSLDSVLRRNSRRSGNRRLGDEEVARIHGRMAGWYNSGLPIIDNSYLDVAGTAAELDRVILARLTGMPVR
ncbi:AAA family ATPase [Streptomyces rubellomurinus]|uniref:AAA family ATPase n=1 Tax=Streptomyces rubellomurinus (strain ATCC 31215) TaxID=359131 RepID=UPI003CC5F888